VISPDVLHELAILLLGHLGQQQARRVTPHLGFVSHDCLSIEQDALAAFGFSGHVTPPGRW